MSHFLIDGSVQCYPETAILIKETLFKQDVGFCHQLLMKLLSRIRGTKKHNLGRDRFFHFQIFETYGNLEIDFSINLNIYFRAVINTFKVTRFFIKISAHCKTGSRHAVVMPLRHTYCLTCFYSYKKFFRQKVRGSWVAWGKKSPISPDKSMYYLEYVFNTLKLTTLQRLKNLFEWIIGYNILKLIRSCSFFTTP